MKTNGNSHPDTGRVQDDLPADLRAAMVDAHLNPLWESRNNLFPRKEQPHVWRWADVFPVLQQIAELTSPNIVERRVVHLVDPQARTIYDETATGTITAGLQILMPGERARPHRHPMNAIRFVVQAGPGAVTIVNGMSVPMERGDLILTPGGSWHEHVNEGSEAVIWADILDVATHLFFGTQNFEPGPVHDLPPVTDDALFDAGAILPDIDVGQRHTSPKKRYPAAAARKALASAPAGADGIRRVRYVNPLTGASALSTLDLSLFELRHDETTRTSRSTASGVCVVAEGAGESVIDGEAIRWERNDVFTIPRNTSVVHRAISKQAVVFQVSDRPVYAKLGLLREDVLGGD